MIYGPLYNNILRMQPVDPDPQDEDQRDGRKRKVWHQGRAWMEADENELPLQPEIPKTPAPSREKRASTGVYADRTLLERAQFYYDQLTTLEEKAAQLCFLSTEANYDTAVQREVELLIQTWRIGGILFYQGVYRRQAYLIERYQQVSKISLLVGNDYLHGLSFYLQGDAFPKNILSEQHYSDMGKAVMVQNRRLGVHLQFDCERGKERSLMSDKQAKAFRKGVRGAQGIVGKEKTDTPIANGQVPAFLFSENPSFKPTCQVQETIGFKTLTFFDASHLEKASLEDELLGAFKKLYDVFLLSGNIAEGIRAIVRLVHSGKISEATLDRHVMKALLIKSRFFKS